LHDLAIRQAASAKVKVLVSNSSARNESLQIDGLQIERAAKLATIASMPVCPGLTSAIHRSPADIVHLHVPNPGAALAFLLSGHTGELVITHHADTLGRQILRRFSDPIIQRAMCRARRIIVTSTRYLNSSLELKPFREKCSVIPLGIALPRSIDSNGPAVQQLRARFGDRIVLAVGRLVPYKGFDVVIRAMKPVDAKLILIGAGPQYSELKQLAASEGVEEKVTMLGRVEDISPYFAAASFFVMPSVTRAEAFGLVQLEAMAAGLPVINTDIESGVPEVSKDGVTGITVQPRDAAALAFAMQLLLDRNDLRDRYGAAARARCQAEYSADLMAARTEAVYSEVLGSNFGTLSDAK
jgi:glycosyltransferase involved in cell wall biosynthesis